jgi:uncharacterized membrane protein (DUF4010 family)
MGIVAVIYGALFAYLAARDARQLHTVPGRAFQPRYAILFALTVTLFLLASASLATRFGAQGATLGIAFAGFADVHSASASAARLLSNAILDEPAATTAVLLAVAANSATKAVVAWASGGWPFVRALAPGLVLMLAALTLGAWMTGLV